MAAAINREVSEREIPIQMTPMIDVTFQLLVFFLCTLRFQTLEGKLSAHLPRAVGSGAVAAGPLEKVGVRIEVAEEGRKVAEGSLGRPYDPSRDGRAYDFVGRVLRYSLGPRATEDLGTLRSWLAEQARVNPGEDGRPRPCAIDARAGVRYGEVVRVLDLASEAGFQEIAFVGAVERG